MSKVYGFCDAGCKWPVVKEEDVQKISRWIELSKDNSLYEEERMFELEVGKRYRIYFIKEEIEGSTWTKPTIFYECTLLSNGEYYTTELGTLNIDIYDSKVGYFEFQILDMYENEAGTNTVEFAVLGLRHWVEKEVGYPEKGYYDTVNSITVPTAIQSGTGRFLVGPTDSVYMLNLDEKECVTLPQNIVWNLDNDNLTFDNLYSPEHWEKLNKCNQLVINGQYLNKDSFSDNEIIFKRSDFKDNSLEVTVMRFTYYNGMVTPDVEVQTYDSSGSQTTYTAGEGITIVDGVISVSYPNGDEEAY